MRTWLGRAGVAFAAIALLSTCASSWADVNVGSVIKLYNGIANGYSGSAVGGGEFGVYEKKTDGTYNAVGAPNEDFITFCAERSEHISMGTEVIVSALNTKTVLTGNVLSNAAGWLFREFSKYSQGDTSALDGLYDGTKVQATGLQLAIWHYIGNQADATEVANNAAATAYKNLVIANATEINALTSYGGVRIMNLVDSSGNNKQDQLWWNGTPDTSTGVPEPMSAGLWLTALAMGTVVVRRRRKRA